MLVAEVSTSFVWAFDHVLVSSDESRVLGEATRCGYGVSLGNDGRASSRLVDSVLSVVV